MKHQFIFLLACALSLCASCKKEEVQLRDTGLGFEYYPRQCNNIATLALENHQGYFWEQTPKVEQPIKAQDFLLCLFTTNGPLKAQIAEYPNLFPETYSKMGQRDTSNYPIAPGNKKLERLLGDDYYRGVVKTRSTNQEGLDWFFIKRWEYRVTGVKDFNIVATTPLFGQAAGTSLNPYFSIFEFHPKQIITHATQSLVWGYRSQNKVETIAQWLALKPMAPPVIVFRFNAIPPEVPAHVKFVSILETTDGKVLRDTTEVEIRD